MIPGSFRFEHFSLDTHDRQLRRNDVPVELNGRYFDALALLVREGGKLVSKSRFLEEVWRGVPVTDEALTQCIKTLRRQLGDNAAAPRFIETVPKHGYRFIAPVEPRSAGLVEAVAAPADARTSSLAWRWRFLRLGSAATIGGAVAGILGGLIYGFAGASALQAGAGAVSVLLVLVSITFSIALLGGAGVGFGIAAATYASRRLWPSVSGGALGGLVVGAFVKLLGLDAFDLLFGQSPGDITGAAEGALLGGAVGFGAWIAARDADAPLRRGVVVAGAIGGVTGILIALSGGRLMGGSLDLLARRFPGSRLRLDGIGALLGEREFGPISQIVTGGLEGAVFAACIVAAMTLARRNLALVRDPARRG